MTVVVPEIVPRSWWGHLLHNKTSLFIRTAFLFRPNVVVTAVPYLHRARRASRAIAWRTTSCSTRRRSSRSHSDSGRRRVSAFTATCPATPPSASS